VKWVEVMGLRLIIGAIGVVAVLGVAFWVYERFVDRQMPITLENADRARFPTVRGSSLSRQNYVFPGDIEGEVAFLMIAFQQYQQGDVNTWLPVAGELANEYADLAYYELPTIQRLTAPARAFIDGGMRTGIPDQQARDTTVTLYLDKAAFREALDIPTEDIIVAMLINRQGDVLWRAQGPATEQAERDLRIAIAKALTVE
jgi:hypothetical protein